MKMTRGKIVALLAALLIPTAHAEDIDIFGGAGGSEVPNVLIAVDSRASNDAAVSPYTCSYAPLSNGKMLDMVQCALYMSVNNITSQPALLGKLRVGLMHVGPKSNKYGEMMYPSSAPWDLPLMDTSGIAAFKSFIIPPTDIKSQGGAGMGDEMAEAWAFLTGHASPHDSSLNYTTHLGGTLSCRKTYLIMVGNVDDKHSNPSNSAGGDFDDLAAARDPTPTASQLAEIHTGSLGTHTGEDDSTIDEWARYMYGSDFNTTADDKQNIVTYGIGTYGSGVWLDKAQEMQSMADQGGGKFFLVNNLDQLVKDFTSIFLEIAAVNTVFASSSLPISSNGQGTYLNQVFIGMFRPDSQDNPRWMGNLKQYQFGVGGTTSSPTLFLADKNGDPAINSAGSGFITPTAVSFWNPDVDTSTLPDSIGGFWTNSPQSAGGGFDNPDGEIVEKGGVGQQIRLANLQDNYTTNPATPRNLYTCNGACATASALSATPFATTNSSIDTTALGITGSSSSVSSISRSGTTVTMALSAAPTPTLTTGQNVTITGASNIELNGTFAITLVNSTTFTYTIVESPPTPSTGTFTASIPGAVATITSLTRTTSTTATATTSAAHGFSANQFVTIAGANQSEYTGSVQILTVTPTTFTYTIKPMGGSPTSFGNATGAGSTIALTGLSLGAVGSGPSYSATITANYGSKLPGAWKVGTSITITNAVPSAYNQTYTIASIPTNKNNGSTFTFNAINTTPASPATGSPITADPSATVVLSSLTHTASCSGATPSTTVTVTATGSATLPSSFTNGAKVTISGTPGTRENAYLGSNLTIANVNTGSKTFTYSITSSPPCSPSASGVSVLTSTNAIDRTSLINWVRGDDLLGDELSPDPGTITIRPSVHGDSLHSRPAVVNYGQSFGVVVFYGSNDGVFHAINGNQPLNGSLDIGSTPPGGEIWGFIPTEFFTKFKRLYANTPPVALASLPTTINGVNTQAKDYFFDGSTGVYQNGTTVSVFMSARRGGRLLYALNVNDPTAPKYLWKATNASTDMGELGYTWSTPKIAQLRGYANPVVIFGGGYDPNEDNEPPTADTMGRAIYILDATDGHVVWRAVFSGSGTAGSCTGNPCTLSDMTYAIPADITLINRDFDSTGYIDRLYAADLGGNIWRVDLEPAGYTAIGALDSSGTSTGLNNQIGPSTWRVSKFASLGGTATTKRKFFYPPDVVTTKTFDMVLDGTGDREHPLYDASSSKAYAIWNRFYALKDTNIGPTSAGWTTIVDGTSATTQPSGSTTISGLTNATSGNYDPGTTNSGFFINFANPGEKAVNAPTTIGGFTYIGTSTPPAPTSQACNNLGTARGYQINFLTGAAASVIFANQGLPPSPVAGLVDVVVDGADRLVPFCLGCGNPAGTGADSTSSIGGGKPPIPVPPVRKRLYWYLDKHDN